MEQVIKISTRIREEVSTRNRILLGGRPASKAAPIFGQRLAALRRGKGLSQRELAAKLNTTREAIDYYERRAQNQRSI